IKIIILTLNYKVLYIFKNMTKKIIWVTVFAIAMGFLETSIVVYLRELYYPEGFEFPLKGMKSYLIWTELAREAATIIMLAGIAWLAGTNVHTRFAWFIYTFAIWDIFYYVFLKVILNWPSSWFTWDVLFLIPCLWSGPVLAPLILSLMMVLIWATILFFDRLVYLKINILDYALMTLASVIHILNFCWDNMNYLINAPTDTDLHVLHLTYIPQYFNWWIFTFACTLTGWAIFNIWNRNIKLLKALKEGQLF
ncbi:MAG: hypothetical protein ACKVQB_10645, partial [Bacteroidia bacterium]